MDPIRIPTRYPTQTRDHFARYVVATLLVLILLIVGGKLMINRFGAPPALELSIGAPQVVTAPSVVYRCVEAGRSYDQSTPCMFAPPPSAKPPIYQPTRPNPNQSLLDDADARYAREVRRAVIAGHQLDQQVAAARQSERATQYRAFTSCAALCESLGVLRTQMRSGYSARMSEYFHDEQNAIFQQMREHDCRACP
jgi:hypothetical protein